MTSVSSSLTTSPKSARQSESPLDAPFPSENETFRERFLAALPLFVVGGACVAAAVYLFLAATAVGGSGTVHLRPWVLFVALGLTGLSAGTICLFAEEATSAPAPLGMPVAPVSSPRTPTPAAPRGFGRPRPGYPGPSPEEMPMHVGTEGLGSPSPAGVPAARAAPASSRRPFNARDWDESDIPPTAASSSSKDAWDEGSEEFEAAASQPAPPEVVLHQLDELELSLRKKPASPPPD